MISSLKDYWFSVSPDLVIAPSVQFFILIVPLLLLCFAYRKNIQVQNSMLLLFSMYFYYRLIGTAILLPLALAAVHFQIAKILFKESKENLRKLIFFCALFFAFLLLFFSKYSINIVPNLFEGNDLLSSFASIIGISYIVFKSTGYLIDIYTERIEPEQSFVIYLLYLLFFPSVIAGPVNAAREVLPQLRERINLTAEDASSALLLFVSGILKKVVFADFIAFHFLDRVYESPAFISSTEAVIAFIFTPFRVYFDFSGYTDIALGTALLFGIKLKDNFNAPFSASTLRDFWFRWHITLLDWLRDYIFTPLTLALRNHKSAGVITAITLTFVISGLWHGATLVFLLWGLSHATFMILEHFLQPVARFNTSPFALILWRVLVLTFLFCSFMLFLSPNLETAVTLYSLCLQGISLPILGMWLQNYSGVATVFIASIAFVLFPKHLNISLQHKFYQMPHGIKAIIIFTLLLLVYQFSITESKPFIYLEF